MPKHNKTTTKRKAKRTIRKTGKKPVVISKRTIRKYGPSITKGSKIATGKKKKPTSKGKVKSKIKYVAAVPRKKGKRKKYKMTSRPMF